MARQSRTSPAATAQDLNAEMRKSGWTVVKRVVPYLWPDGMAWVKWRVVIALGMFHGLFVLQGHFLLFVNG